MKYTIDRKAGVPAYMQLYRQLREDIVAGIYPTGGKLPSKRLIAAELDISVITVEHTYAILCDEGYVETRPRSGYFVCYRESDCLPVAESRSPVRPTVGHNGDDELPFSVLAKTMRRVLTEYGETVRVKSPNNGCAELRTAIAAYLKRSRGMEVHPSQIIIGSGAEYLYSLIVQLLGRDRIFALENPSYDKIRKVYTANGATCDLLRMGPDGIRTEELERTAATVLHVTPYNSFPSGVTADASKRREYIRWAVERGGWVVEDDFDSELTVSTKAEDTLFSLEPERTVLYLNTFTRTVAPAVRVGYMVLPRTMLEYFEKTVGFYSCTVPVFEQYVLAELLQSGDFERHVNRVRRRRRVVEKEKRKYS